MRMPTMAVWGANTGVGKTLFSAGLAAACERAKVRAPGGRCRRVQQRCAAVAAVFVWGPDTPMLVVGVWGRDGVVVVVRVGGRVGGSVRPPLSAPYIQLCLLL